MALTTEQQIQVDALKRLLGASIGTYTDEQLWALIQAGTPINTIAATIWTEYAASVATLIDVSEGSSSRKLGSLYKQALEMAKSLTDEEVDPVPSTGYSTTRRIVRA